MNNLLYEQPYTSAKRSITVWCQSHTQCKLGHSLKSIVLEWNTSIMPVLAIRSCSEAIDRKLSQRSSLRVSFQCGKLDSHRFCFSHYLDFIIIFLSFYLTAIFFTLVQFTRFSPFATPVCLVDCSVLIKLAH